jgi:hypothetical protein
MFNRNIVHAQIKCKLFLRLIKHPAKEYIDPLIKTQGMWNAKAKVELEAYHNHFKSI